MKTSLALLFLVASVLSSVAQSKFAGDYVGIATPVKWAYLERVVVSVLVYTDGTFILETLSYDFGFLGDNWIDGRIDDKGRFSGLDSVGIFWKGTVSAKGGTVKGIASDGGGKYTFTCFRRYRSAHDPLDD